MTRKSTKPVAAEPVVTQPASQPLGAEPVAPAPVAVQPSSTRQPAVDLRISGKNLLLSGSFEGWQSRLVLGPDLDDVNVSLFVDATSVGLRPANDTSPADRLFSFRSKSVESLGKGRFRVIGDFTGAEPERELAVDVETPLGHTALIALTFAARKGDFGDYWDRLVENATLFDAHPAGEGPQREAAGWLRTPVLAAA
ncbi:MAG TPA: YceI family protein [Polyangia bacterium]|nr:YceI family protein [Polyangia bacterium]